jgi:hypothetical protein
MLAACGEGQRETDGPPADRADASGVVDAIPSDAFIGDGVVTVRVTAVDGLGPAVGVPVLSGAGDVVLARLVTDSDGLASVPIRAGGWVTVPSERTISILDVQDGDHIHVGRDAGARTLPSFQTWYAPYPKPDSYVVRGQCVELRMPATGTDLTGIVDYGPVTPFCPATRDVLLFAYQGAEAVAFTYETGLQPGESTVFVNPWLIPQPTTLTITGVPDDIIVAAATLAQNLRRAPMFELPVTLTRSGSVVEGTTGSVDMLEATDEITVSVESNGSRRGVGSST